MKTLKDIIRECDREYDEIIAPLTESTVNIKHFLHERDRKIFGGVREEIMAKQYEQESENIMWRKGHQAALTKIVNLINKVLE